MSSLCSQSSRGLPVVRHGQRRLHHERWDVQHCRSHLPDGGKFCSLNYLFDRKHDFPKWIIDLFIFWMVFIYKVQSLSRHLFSVSYLHVKYSKSCCEIRIEGSHIVPIRLANIFIQCWLIFFVLYSKLWYWKVDEGVELLHETEEASLT